MSASLLEFAVSFVDGRLPATDFADPFILRWRGERDDGTLETDSPAVSEALSTVFCLADLFNPNDDRLEYELDDGRLRIAVCEAIARISPAGRA